MRLGIVGNGFVGNALYEGFKSFYDVRVHDNNPNRSLHSLKEINECPAIFICVPTPMSKEGKIDLSIIMDVLNSIRPGLTVIKSTITPAGAEKIKNHFTSHDIVFNPEFLTERTAVQDFQNPSRIVLGGDVKFIENVKKIYKNVFPRVKYIMTDYKTACFIKYMSNCFSAVKISIMNEFKQVAEKDNINWEDALQGLLSSGWVNSMHTMVPGPDGDRGFGGKCFPKDINAIISYAIDLGIEPKVLQASWEKNLEVREHKDWLKIPGAVSNNS